jgi:hypothetical protein
MSKDMAYMVGCSWFVMRATKPTGHLTFRRLGSVPGPGPIGNI